MPRTAAFLEQLATCVDAADLLVDPELRAPFENDITGRFSGEACVVARPRTGEQVIAVVHACRRSRIPIVPQGGNTGLVGGGVPRNGEAIISLAGLDAIEEVDPLSQQMICGAGVTLEAVQAEAARHGLALGVDHGARSGATVGGSIATNAGGSRVLRYGPMRDQVVGLEAITADGAVIQRLPGFRKETVGYDLAALITGSEGTLAIVTRAHLRLVPRLPSRTTVLLGLRTMSDAMEVLHAVRRLSSLEAVDIFWRTGLELVSELTGEGAPFREPFEIYLVVEAAAEQSPTDELVERLSACAGVGDSAIADDESGRRALWSHRERHPEAIRARGIPHKLDVAVPLRVLEAYVDAVGTAVRSMYPTAIVVPFGHLAQGSLHVNVVGVPADDTSVDDAVLQLAVDLGGTISSEHGLGVAKRRWLPSVRSVADVDAMRAIKAGLDPAQLLNPGVMLPS